MTTSDIHETRFLSLLPLQLLRQFLGCVRTYKVIQCHDLLTQRRFQEAFELNVAEMIVLIDLVGSTDEHQLQQNINGLTFFVIAVDMS